MASPISHDTISHATVDLPIAAPQPKSARIDSMTALEPRIEQIYPLSLDGFHQRMDDIRAGKIKRVEAAERRRSEVVERLEAVADLVGDELVMADFRAQEGPTNSISRDLTLSASPQPPSRPTSHHLETLSSHNSTYTLSPNPRDQWFYSLPTPHGTAPLPSVLSRNFSGHHSYGSNDDEAREPLLSRAASVHEAEVQLHDTPLTFPFQSQADATTQKRSLSTAIISKLCCRPGAVTPAQLPQTPSKPPVRTASDTTPAKFKFWSGLFGQIEVEFDIISLKTAGELQGSSSCVAAATREHKVPILRSQSVNSMGTDSTGRLEGPARLSNTIRRAPNSIRSTPTPVPQAPEDSQNALPQSRLGLDDLLRNTRLEDIQDLGESEAHSISELMLQVDQDTDRGNPYATWSRQRGAAVTNVAASEASEDILGPRGETLEETRTRLGQMLDQVSDEAGRRAREAIEPKAREKAEKRNKRQFLLNELAPRRRTRSWYLSSTLPRNHRVRDVIQEAVSEEDQQSSLATASESRNRPEDSQANVTLPGNMMQDSQPLSIDTDLSNGNSDEQFYLKFWKLRPPFMSGVQVNFSSKRTEDRQAAVADEHVHVNGNSVSPYASQNGTTEPNTTTGHSGPANNYNHELVHDEHGLLHMEQIRESDDEETRRRKKGKGPQVGAP